MILARRQLRATFFFSTVPHKQNFEGLGFRGLGFRGAGRGLGFRGLGFVGLGFKLCSLGSISIHRVLLLGLMKLSGHPTDRNSPSLKPCDSECTKLYKSLFMQKPATPKKERSMR